MKGQAKGKAKVCAIGWMLALTLCGCGETREMPLESDEAYSNPNKEIFLEQNGEQGELVGDPDKMLSVDRKELPEESEHGQEESAGGIETNRNASDTVADKLILNELMYGNVGEPLGLGTLVYTLPQSSEEDYKVYFFASKNEDERYLSLSERNLELTEATYIFPDAREGNIPIGKFQEFYYFGTGDMSSDGVDDLLLIACYEVGDEVYYDTRVYVENEDGYTLDNTLTQKLNEKYCNVEEYPVWEVVELPHD